jgi:signal transduction histidine kinase
MIGKRFRWGLTVRLALTLLGVTFTVLTVNDLLIYWEIRHRMEQEIGTALSVAAVSLATQLDGAMVRGLKAEDTESRTYKNIQLRFERFLNRTDLRNAYLFNETGQSLVDARGDVAPGMVRTRLGYDSLELETVFNGQASSSVLFRGPDGLFYKSGYAPVFYEGAVVAAVGIDAGAAFLESVAGLERSMWGLGLICLLLAAVTGTVFAGQLVRPIRKLAAVARGIGRGDLHTPVAVQREDEIGVLGGTMEEMRQDILERDEQLKTMLASVAHEIRNPLAGIELFAELMRKSLDTDDEHAEQADRIIAEARTLKGTINNFLDYARPEKPEPKVVPVREILIELQPFLQKDVEKRHIQLQLTDTPIDAQVYCDPRHLTEILMNLVSNAVQAAPPEGEVRVHTERVNGCVELRVQDNGPGINVESVEKVFMPFFTTKEDGTGLGLAIARKLAENNRGMLHYESPPAAGACFLLTLPGEKPE